MMIIESYRTQLENLNQDLSALTGKTPLVLSYQTGESEQDALYLYGIMGGKDVGKTTLINQLAGTRISIDTDILDEGTNIAVAYCHQNDVASLQRRFAPDVRDRLHYETHERDELRNVVLVDFPDFDSRFTSHRHDVKRLARYLQGILWILSPRKYGDHEFVDQYEDMAQSNENHILILNKMDQLDGIAEPEAVRTEVHSYLHTVCTNRGVPFPSKDRLLLISAITPDRFEFSLLHNRLIRLHTPEEILKAKAHNLKSEFEKNLTRMRSYYALSQQINEIENAIDDVQQWITDRFPEPYYNAVRDRVLSIEPIQQRISAGLFTRRVDGWPILRVLFYPLAGLISFIGGRFAFLSLRKEQDETPRDVLRFEGMSASGRIQQIRLELEDQHPPLVPALGEMPSYVEEVEYQFSRVLQRYEEQVGCRLAEDIAEPDLKRKIMVYSPLVWFPILQPMLLSCLRNPDGFFSLSNITGLFTSLVEILGAGMLLQNAVFLLLFYLIWLVVLYAQGARQVQTEGKEEFQDLWYERFLPWVTDILSKPLLDVRQKWVAKRTQLDNIEGEIIHEMERLTGQKKNSPKQ
jgi:hypothetical protein